MTASDNTESHVTANDQPQALPALAGFSTGKAPPRTAVSDDAETPAAETAQPKAPASKLAQDFDGTEVMRLLAMIYGIQAIPTAIAPLLNDFKLDANKDKPTTADGTLFVTFNDTPIEITRTAILTDEGKLTPELAYKMAAVASLNPSNKPLALSGTPEDRMALFLAAKHFNLEIEEDSIPTIAADKIGGLAATFNAFETAAGLNKSTAAEYLDKPAADKPAAAKKNAVRHEPQLTLAPL